MPLIQGKSRKAMSENIKTEMDHGKPQKQAIAIAYSVKRKNAKKKAAGGSVQSGSKDMNYAEGGNISASNEKRPMPDNRYNDSAEASRNSGNKPPKNDQWTDSPTVKQAQNNTGRQVKPIKHPRMVPQSIYNTRLRDEEDDLQSSASPGAYDSQPPKHDDEEGPDRQGPSVPDMADEHSTHKKPYKKEIEDQYAQDIADADMKRSNAYAKGGQVESSDYDSPENKYEHDFKSDTPSEDEGSGMARSHNEEGQDRQGPDLHDHEAPHSLASRMFRDDEANEDHEMELNPAHDKHSPDDSEDQPEEESHMDHEDSIAAAIMSKKQRGPQDSDSDEDRMAMMALGGEILEDNDDIHSHGSMDTHEYEDQVDLSRNADEDANEEDQSSFDALRKENYSESPGLRQMGSPRDSNLKSDSEEMDSHDRYDRIDKIRSKMNAKRQFKMR